MAENRRQPKSPRSQSEKEVDQAVGHRIKSLRELKGDSQKDFAQPRLSEYEQELLAAAGPAGSAWARRIFAMVNNFDKIKDPEMREGLLKIARSFAKGEGDRSQVGGVEDPDAGDGTESDDGKP